MNHIASLIKNSNHSIEIFASPELLTELYRHHLDLLFKAKERGVKIRILTNEIKDPEVLRTLASLGEVKIVDKSSLPIDGKFMIVDDTHLFLNLTDYNLTHETQMLGIWSRSQFAALNTFKPIFELLWKQAKPF